MARFSSLIAVAVCVFLPAFATAQGPPALYAVTHLTNHSKAKATVYYKYSDNAGPWERIVLERGRTWIFSTNVNGQIAPPMIVRIDIDTNGSRYVEHVLSRGGSADQFSGGHQFAILQLEGVHTRYIRANSPGAFVQTTGREGRP